MTARLKSRISIVALFLLFFLPVVSALVLNITQPGWLHLGSTNRGTLVDPPRALNAQGLFASDGEALAANFFADRWTLVHWDAGICERPCEDALVETRQARLALGKDMDRVQRLLLTPVALPDAARKRLLAAHPELTFATAGSPWPAPLRTDSQGVPALGLVDPQGFFMMHYRSDQDATQVLNDLERLLRISKIG